jgi:hypothetical protein
VPLEFGHLGAGFHFVPEGRAIVVRRFIAGLAIHRIGVPEGRSKLLLRIRRACRWEAVASSISELLKSSCRHATSYPPRTATAYFQPVSSVDDGWFTFCFGDDGSGSPEHEKPSWLLVRYRLEATTVRSSGVQ